MLAECGNKSANVVLASLTTSRLMSLNYLHPTLILFNNTKFLSKSQAILNNIANYSIICILWTLNI